MPKWKIHARHTPCPVKLVQIEAATEDQAVQKFVDLNVRSCQAKFKDGWKVAVKAIEGWIRDGGLDGLDVTLVGDESKEPEGGPPETIAETPAEPERGRTAIVEAEAPPVVSVSNRRPQQKRKAKVEVPAEAGPGNYDPSADEYGERPYQATV